MAPLFIVDIPEVAAARLVLPAWGLTCVAAFSALCRNVIPTSPVWVQIGCVTAIALPAAVVVCVWITPDIILSSLLLYLALMVQPKNLFSKKRQFGIGALAGLAFLLVAGPWIGVLSAKHKRFVFSTTFAITSGIRPRPPAWDRVFKWAKLETGLAIGFLLTLSGLLGVLYAIATWRGGEMVPFRPPWGAVADVYENRAVLPKPWLVFVRITHGGRGCVHRLGPTAS